MGMFDWVRCSFPLDSSHDPNCMMQTKDLKNFMEFYWISPTGELYIIDDSKSWRIVDDPLVENKLFSLKKEYTGINGKVKPVGILRRIKIYPAKWDGEYNEWPEYLLDFLYGKLVKCKKVVKTYHSEDADDLEF